MLQRSQRRPTNWTGSTASRPPGRASHSGPSPFAGGGPLCIFGEVLRSDAEDEEYEAAVLKWIYGYNAYERLGSALNTTAGSLWQEMRDTGKFPVDAGVDALRAWAFVIARALNKGSSRETTRWRPTRSFH